MSQTFLLEPDIIAAAENVLPELNTDLVLAKNYLKTQSAASGDSLYDHLVDMVHNLLTHKPPDAVDHFERLSWDVKREKFRPNFDLLNEVFLAPPQLVAVRRTEEMFLMIESKAENLDDDLSEEEPDLDLEEELQKPRVADLLEHNQNFKEGGYGLPDSECFPLYIALKMLAAKEGVASVRFFGKIFGTKANYYVAETELTAEEMEKRIRDFDMKDMAGEGEGEDVGEEKPVEDEEKAEAEEVPEEVVGEEIAEKPSGPVPPKLPPIPVSTWQPPPPIPPERPGEGVNRKVYWVCHCPGEQWVSLPDVTPDQIRVARLTVHALTGDLEAEVILFPPFDGVEKNYLRAQLARLAAATAVSPQGFYTFGSGEEEEDVDVEDGGDMDLSPNPYYEGHSIKDLLDPSYWVHHERHILKQGRTIWWNQDAGMDEAIAEEEDEDAFPQQQPESGPPLMTSLSEDARIEQFPAWTARSSTRLVTERALVTLRSTRWPGAVAYATSGKKSECMYVGWALKFLPPNFSPMQLPKVQDEYPLGPEIMEMADPTAADEEAYRILHLPPEPAQEMMEEEVLTEEEEEDEDEDEE
ncbi:radial spoke head protein 6 homolog A [Plutella xylostella]|uniref:radial spoke head protein 6 homolog A n=1 Tax=Plutella xylostella TaxID=51655 RepID=UPI0020326968|nr:radial spoke head protein 6 homolog A [Plutella xylostella]